MDYGGGWEIWLKRKILAAWIKANFKSRVGEC